MPIPTALELAIKAAGSQLALANKLGIKSPSIDGWHRDGVPLARCASVEALTGVPCEALRPDVTWTRDEDRNVTGYHVPVRAA
ncbi:MAG: transcriptional regulator [Rhodanobacter sp.]